ncbi:MAG: fluoride efflux transporter CrcB [Deltaproteobacteria bacterium]|nr:fluoride efflux transporter CrcB [Deltaproteobacteria bacterium]
MQNVFTIFIVGTGGFVGSVLRYLMSQFGQRFSITFPHGTLWANFIGCLFLGIVTAAATETQSLSPSTRLFLATGVCGGFTTMSSFSYETVRLLQDSEYLYATGYFLATIVGCIILFGLGLFGTKLLLKG